jgi:hypothetical protein
MIASMRPGLALGTSFLLLFQHHAHIFESDFDGLKEARMQLLGIVTHDIFDVCFYAKREYA